ncbi:MAG: hypothetical protein F6J87_05745 [Spirulina sp. SIO3F2]|nr:hypothetical protein [Spirulina sp. SIO3F2]
MPSSTLSTAAMTMREQAVWQSLKQAIAESSGFQRWQQTLPDVERVQSTEAEVEEQVRRYLRETLATLAY